MPRSVRWARVEYQPNLEIPVDPVPLGVIVEELHTGGRHLVILGREPRGPIAGLQLESAWGPFREVVTEWVESLSKSLREFIDDLRPDEYAIDELARRWRWNVYLRQPETKPVLSSIYTLDHYGRRWYGEYVGIPFPPPSPTRSPRAARLKQRSWLARSNLLQARLNDA
jgi:hypothetical protein